MDYRFIDMERYPRRDHFEAFRRMRNPMVQLTVNVEITDWLRRIKEAGLPFFLSFQYAVVRAANRVPEFRQRIRDGRIVEYAFCNPSYIVALPDGTYRYCNVIAGLPFPDYLREAKKKQRQALLEEHLEEDGDVEGFLFTTSVPWLSYAGLEMPWPDPDFSVPNIGWGKYVRDSRVRLEAGQPVERELVTLPVTVMVNHALVDGIHIARFFEYLNDELERFPFE